MTHINLDTALDWVPEACTLPTVDRPLRLAELDELFRTCVVAVRREDALRLHLELRAEASVAARAADLAARESGCCSFFTFVLTLGAGMATLDVVVPAARRDVMDAVAARAEAHCGKPR